MAAADAVILILTKNWFESKWCFAEFTQARALGKAIFPLIESPTGETFVSSDIQHLNLVKDREGGLDTLAANLTEIVLNARGGFHWDHKRPPYPGLLAFEEDDAAIYFGRDDDIRRVIERLNARRSQGGAKLVTVLGASGSGKSSLLRAGVLPRLKQDKRNWIALRPFRPQLHPLEELAQVVANALGQSADWRRWRDAFIAEDIPRTLSDLARDLRAAQSANEAQILITIDQAEELFGATEKPEAEIFLRIINDFLDERLPFLVVLALRSDYLGQLQQAPGLMAQPEVFPLKPMPLIRVRDIIDGPARIAGFTVEDALVMAAMRDAATDDSLPLLAFALRELYGRFGQTGRLTVETYNALGDQALGLSPLENAVRRKADEVIAAAKPVPEDLQALKEAFVPAMVRVNAEGEYVRRPARMDSLPEKARPLIDRLARARLLVIQKEEDGATMVEVAHEALLRKWPLLRGWLDEEREFLIGKDRIEQDLRDWQKAPPSEKTEALLSGLKLTRARTWLISKPMQLSEAEREFIQASISAYEAEAAQRERIKAQAESFLLSGQSQQALGSGDIELALRRGVEAVESWPTHEAERALRKVLEGTLVRLILFNGRSVNRAVFSSDGKRIVTASDDRTARVWDVATGSPLATLTGHTDYVLDAAFSPDGKCIVTASRDHTARVWDAETGNLQAALGGHGDWVYRAGFSPDGKRIVTASRDCTARVWDAGARTLMVTLAGHSDWVYRAAFSPDGKRVVTASMDNTAQVWDAESGKSLATLSGHTDAVLGAAFLPDGVRIVTASKDHTARLWNSHSGKSLTTLLGHTDLVWYAAVSPDGKRIVTASKDHTARVWDPESGDLLITLSGHTRTVYHAAFSPDGKRIVTASLDQTARLWDADTGHLQAALAGHNNEIWRAAFSPDGRRIVTASMDNTARVWDVEFGHPLATLIGHADVVFDAVFSPNGISVLTAGKDHTARIWDSVSGHLEATLTGHSDAVIGAAFSPDGRRIVTTSRDGTARVWDAGTCAMKWTLSPSVGTDAAFSPDGKRIVTASPDMTAGVWDVESGQLVNTLTGHTGLVYRQAFSPDGTRIVTASMDSTARVWDAETGHPLAKLIGHTDAVLGAAFSPDGKRIVTVSPDMTARVWDAESGSAIATLTGHADRVSNAKFSPDGRRIVTSSADNTARIWDAESGNLLATSTGHTHLVLSASFTPDGKRIVTASADKTARIWDAEMGHSLGILAVHSDAVLNATFSPDGKRVVTASKDGTARIYIADLNDLLKWAKTQLPIESGK